MRTKRWKDSFARYYFLPHLKRRRKKWPVERWRRVYVPRWAPRTSKSRSAIGIFVCNLGPQGGISVSELLWHLLNDQKQRLLTCFGCFITFNRTDIINKANILRSRSYSFGQKGGNLTESIWQQIWIAPLPYPPSPSVTHQLLQRVRAKRGGERWPTEISMKNQQHFLSSPSCGNAQVHFHNWRKVFG